ncbi:MAG TPA: type II toxin-antitoxin system RelE/ParE family toxin [Pirellulales bacterium]|nr:type II toxin-antitoxin system RelE/ParE family toxin [Pirellulales bacterium]
MWQVATTDEFDSWFADLADDGQTEVIAKVQLLKFFGPKLGRPYADTLKGSKHANMKELRADTAAQVLRVAFAFDPERHGILLVGGDKSGAAKKRFYKQLIAKADALFDAYLLRLKAIRAKQNIAKEREKGKRIGKRKDRGE